MRVDEDRWVERYRSLEKPLYNLVYRWLWDAEASRDVVQEAFMRCWERRSGIKQDGFTAYVYRTALNLAANTRRSRKLWQYVSLSSLPDDHDCHAQIPEFMTAPVRDAIDGLPEQLKRVLLLCEIAGMSYREIADVLGIREGTVGSRRYRAVLLLKTRLKAAGVDWNEAEQ